METFVEIQEVLCLNSYLLIHLFIVFRDMITEIILTEIKEFLTV